MTNPPQQPPVAFELHADSSLTGGVYANGVVIWSTPYEFTLDFVVNTEPPQLAQTEDGQTVIRAPHQLVSRVRLPPGKVFDLIRAINENMTNYERAFGPIQRAGQDEPLYPPPDLGNTGNEPPQG
jgi:Protein of unknown function (DUF3467)